MKKNVEDFSLKQVRWKQCLKHSSESSAMSVMPYASKCYRWNGTQIILKPDECVGLIQRKEVEFTGWHSEANNEHIQTTKTRLTNWFDIQQSIHLIYALALGDGSKNIELNSFWNLENYHRSVTRTNGIFLFGKRVLRYWK